jgi:hypothetical protein
MKIYICGSAHPALATTLEVFQQWEKTLTARLALYSDKIEIINPTNIETTLPWGDFIEERIALVRSSDILFVFGETKYSAVARLEFAIAYESNKMICYDDQLEKLVAFVSTKFIKHN